MQRDAAQVLGQGMAARGEAGANEQQTGGREPQRSRTECAAPIRARPRRRQRVRAGECEVERKFTVGLPDGGLISECHDHP